MEAGTGGTHPLITQLRPLFAELHNNSSGTTITAVVRRLEYIIDEEKDGLFHRNAMKSTADARLLPQWLNRQLELLFEKPDTHLAGVRVLRALQTVEYVDLTEMTSLFSRLLVRCVISTVDFPTSTEAAAGWGLLLNVGGNAMEGIVNECIRFSIALLRCPGHDAAFLTHSSDMGASPSVPPSMHSPTYSPPTSSSNPDLLGSGSGGDHRAPNGSTQARLDRAQPSPSPEGVTRDSPQFSSAPQLAQATSGESRNPLPEASERPTAPSMIELAKVGSLALGNGDGEPLDLSHTTKLAGCLLLQQVARKAPTAVVGHIHDALEGLQMAIIDASLQVRLCAADVLLSIMRLCYRTLEERHFREWQDRWMHSVLRGLNFASSAVLHGSLLTFNALLSSIITHRDEAGGGSSVVEVTSLTSRGIHEVWNCAIQQLSSSSSSEVAPIREEILNVLTLMAQYDGPQFLETTAEQLKALHARVFTATTGYDERTLLFTSLSRLIRVLPEVVPLFLESTIAHIYTSLTPRPNRDRCPAAATCLATLTEVKPYAVRPYLQYLLKPLFSGTITEDFTQNVAKLCAVFPELRSTCLSRTLEATKDQLRIAHQRHQSSAYSASECRTFILANLNALGSLDFAGYSTLSFLSEVVVKYISDPHEDIRRSSINLCFKLVLSGCSSSFCVQSESGRVQHRGHEHIRLVSTIMKKLANAAVADPESDIRLHTLEHFTTRHDQLLAMQNIASILFPALHDKFQNQLAAVRLLGRISPLNPSCICPMLRCVMVQCAADLRLFPQAKKQEQATAVLSAVIECAPAMARPYISSLLHDCAGRLKEVGSQPTPVITALLSCIGKLTCYAEGDDVAVVASLRPFVVAHILDASSTAKKQEAIRTLGEIIRTTKEVNVYEEHPRLLPVLLSALHGGFKETWPLRQDILKLMGIIGAVDPVRLSQIVSAQQHPSAVGAETDNSVLPAGSLRTEDSIAVHVVRNVLNVLQLPSLSDDQCISAAGVLAEILSLTKTDEVFLTAFYPEIFAAILQRISLQPKIREELIHCLTRMVPLCDVYVHQHMSDIMGTVSVFINTAKLNVLVEILALFAEIRRTLGERFRPYLAHILPPIISVVHAAPRMSEVAFSFLVRMGKMLDGYLTNVVPCVCDVAVNPLLQPNCRVAALQALRQFARRLPRLFFYSSQCMHTLCYVLREHTSTHASVVSAALAACVDVARNLGGTFDNYTMILHPILDAMGPEGQQTKAALVNVISMGGRVVTSDYVDGEDDLVPLTTSNLPQALPKRQGAAGSSEDKYALLRNTLLIQDRVTEEDWNSWLKQLSVELLRASPSLSHGYAYYLAQNHEPFARHMLHSAFAVCYAEMDTATRKTVTRRLEAVLGDKQVPSEVLQELLNLSEYMERLESRFTRRDASQKSSYSNLLFDVNILMESTERCNLFAKALHYVEQQFNETIRDYELGRLRGTATPLHKDQWKRVLQLSEKAIYLFNVLGQRESAEGVLEYVQGNFISLTGKLPDELPSMMDAQLFEKLQWWSQSLRAYQQRLQVEPNKFIHIDGLMRSLDNLGDYSRLLDSWKLFAPRVSRKEASDLAFWGSHAAWLLRRWDEMETITALIPEDGYVGTTATFYRAVLCVRRQQFHEAERFVRLCRKRLDHTLSTLVAESYNRAYPIFVGLQQLSELEEFIFVQRNNQPLEPWRRLWEKRLSVMAYSGWGGTLANHTLMTDAMDELDMWLRFVSLSRANGRERTSSEVLYELLGSQSLSHALKQPVLPTPAIALAAFQHMHDLKERDHAIELLEQYVSTMDPNSNDIMEVSSRPSLAMCHAKLANWLFDQANANGTQLDAAPAVVRRVLAHLSRATSLDGENGAIWHSWARFNHALVHQTPPSHTLEHHLICALDGYMRSVRLSQELEDILGFLSLWFHHGSRTEVLHNLELQTNILMVSSSVWLKVIPQIIARMDSEDSVISESVCKLLSLVAKAHPQALLYSLNVTTSSLQGGARSSEPNERRKASQRILARIAELHRHGQVLVNEAALVCQELVRCAVLWTELWFDELERAWCQWGRDQNVRTVRGMLQPLLDLMERPETMAESHFVTEFGELIGHACECLDQAMLSSGAEAEAFMDDAWNRFKSAVRRMEEQISSMSSLALQLVSPKLLQHGKDLSLVVPGQYHESGNYPHILSFQPTLKVMNSKQHPRRLYIQGSDGEVYKFLLKGHEDLRLDERVMQLLAFVNTLLDKHTTIQRRDGTIQVFSVTPLSDNAGLVGWVDHCETLHQLIREYRVHSKHLSIEVNIMQSFGVNLERLMPIQHVEPFELALEQTDGTDLAQSLWTRAPSTESWVDRRSTYISSLATMSMVGHILGLGDRHPSNLMIDAFSGRVVHIDFGDCFEVAQHRTAFPEKVPFRLTRMLIKAMDMGTIEGIFPHACTGVMRVLREEGSSILALLEAFVHDPLVSWWRGEEETEECTEVPDTITTEADCITEVTSSHTTAPRAPTHLFSSPGSARPTSFAMSSSYIAMGESFKRIPSAVGSLPMKRAKELASRRTTPTASLPKSSTPQSPTTGGSTQLSKAQKVVNRIKEKLEGREFVTTTTALYGVGTRGSGGMAMHEELTVEAQVSRLLQVASSHENLCVHYQGWCPFW